MITGKVISVTKVESIDTNLDLCRIAIDFDELHIFGIYEELQKYLDKTVQYMVRKDVYNGKQINVVVNLVDNYTVQTLDRVEGIRLIPENCENRVVSNFRIDDLKFGDSDRNCIGFLAGVAEGSSQKTKWVDCTVIDSRAKAFNLRIFTNRLEDHVDGEATLNNLVGHYIRFNVTFTKYGYQSDEIELYNVDVVAPPEVDTAISIIKSAVKDDDELLDYMQKYNYIETLKTIIDGELGYHLVRVASEILMIDALHNITNTYDKQLMIRAAVTSRGYLLPSKTKFSRPVLNVNKVIKTQLITCKELILILDPLAEEEINLNAKRMYMTIANFVDTVIKERRGLNEEINELIDINQLRSVAGGLL